MRLMSALTLLETKVVLFARLGIAAVETFDELLAKATRRNSTS